MFKFIVVAIIAVLFWPISIPVGLILYFRWLDKMLLESYQWHNRHARYLR